MRPAFYSGRCYFGACIKGIVNDLARGQAFELGPYEGSSFAWLHVLELDDGVKGVVELNAQSVLKITRSSSYE